MARTISCLTSPTKKDTTPPLEQYTKETFPKADDLGVREVGADQIFGEVVATAAEGSNTMDESTNEGSNTNDSTGENAGKNQDQRDGVNV